MSQPTQSVNRKTLFLRACRSEPVERVPVWIMRQAGRYLPEYRAIRKKHNFLQVCRTPELAIEVSLQPQRILGVDAVIVFSDILIPAGAMGLPFELTDKGPVIESPLRTAAQIHELSLFDPETETRFLMDTIRGLTKELGPDIPVLGFAAAPWTLACYMIEGHGQDGFPAAKAMLYSDPELFRSLLKRIARATARYLRAQIDAGASAVQLFDTWVGELTAEQYREFALPATQLLIEEIGAGDTPVILYTKASSHLLAAAAKSGASVLSVDWRVDLATVREQVGPHLALQGNVDPCVLLGAEEVVRRAARATVENSGGIGHILNLGHGILRQTPVENALAFVQAGQSAPVAARVPLAAPVAAHAPLEGAS
ncbi:MAG TPA: uroporphyrinogen decarboxylase [Candidatus Dormibacteraeota bacterium]|nr:uroporphyrinogen decarboxylase [Candidatus Dormibacteraeota bacterium]